MDFGIYYLKASCKTFLQGRSLPVLREEAIKAILRITPVLLTLCAFVSLWFIDHSG